MRRRAAAGRADETVASARPDGAGCAAPQAGQGGCRSARVPSRTADRYAAGGCFARWPQTPARCLRAAARYRGWAGLAAGRWTSPNLKEMQSRSWRHAGSVKKSRNGSKRQITLDGIQPGFGAEVIVGAARRTRYPDGAHHLSGRIDRHAAADHHHAGQVLDGLLGRAGFVHPLRHRAGGLPPARRRARLAFRRCHGVPAGEAVAQHHQRQPRRVGHGHRHLPAALDAFGLGGFGGLERSFRREDLLRPGGRFGLCVGGKRAGCGQSQSNEGFVHGIVGL